MCMPCRDGVIRPSVRRQLCYSSLSLLCTYQSRSGKNYYDILGVKRDASIAEIKSAFYKLSKKYHPDALRQSEGSSIQGTIYLEIKDAYEVLKDNKKRQEYDLALNKTSSHHRTYGENNETNCQNFRKYNSSNFYARTPEYDNGQWYEWYRNRRMDEMETPWIRRFYENFKIFRARRREWFDHMKRRQEIVGHLKQYPEAVLESKEKRDRLQRIEKKSLLDHKNGD